MAENGNEVVVDVHDTTTSNNENNNENEDDNDNGDENENGKNDQEDAYEKKEDDIDNDNGTDNDNVTSKPSPQDLSQSGSPNEQYGGRNNSSNKVHHVFVFCNPTSGGNQAAKLVDINVDELRFHHDLLPKDQFVHAYIFNLKKAENRQAGFEKLGNLVRNMPDGEDVVVVAAGGDGTVKWVLGELRKPGVEALGVPIGIIPFGTGNDLARVMEWGSTAPAPLIGYGVSALRDILVQFVLAEQRVFDVWSVKLEVDAGNGGHFCVVENGQVVPRPDGKTVVEEEMINYFSLGADAQAVFSFEQNRKTTQLANKFQFAVEGGKLAMPFGKPQPLQALGLETIRREGGNNLAVVTATDKKKLASSPSSVPGGSDNDYENENGNEKDVPEQQAVPLTKPMSGLVMQNIPSYSAGSNFWGPPKKKSPFAPQNVGDGLLEMMQLRQLTDIAIHKASAGTAGGMGKLDQAQSYTLGFKSGGSDVQIYFQVDGEGYKAVGLKKVEVTHAFKVIILKRRHPASELLSQPNLAAAQAKIEKKNKAKKGFVSTVPLQGQVFRRTGTRAAWRIRHAALIISRYDPENAATHHHRASIRKSMALHHRHSNPPRPEVSLVLYRKKKKVAELQLKFGVVSVQAYDQIPERERVWTPNASSTFRVTVDATLRKRPLWICAQNEKEAAEWMEALTDQSNWQQ